MKPDYGNWVPTRIMYVLLVVSIVSFGLSNFLVHRIITGALTVISIGSFGFFLYLGYVYWLLERDNKAMQKQFWNLVVDKLDWDGQGKALDVGTGNGPVAILLAKKYPNCTVKGIDYWGEPWTYTQGVCENNAEIEGVSERTSFEHASAVALPFDDGAFDAVLSNFVFHAIKGEDRMQLIQESLRVLKDGGAYSFQDLFNDEFYSEDFLEQVKRWGLKEVNFTESKDYIEIPFALKPKHMTGGSGVLHGLK